MRPMVLAVLAVLAGCTADEHGHTPVAEVREATSDGGTWQVSWVPDPDPVPFNEHFALVFSVSEAGAPSTDVTVVADAEMPEHGHGMTTAPVVTDNGDGTFRAEGMLFHMDGNWQILADITRDGSTEQAVFDVPCCE